MVGNAAEIPTGVCESDVEREFLEELATEYALAALEETGEDGGSKRPFLNGTQILVVGCRLVSTACQFPCY